MAAAVVEVWTRVSRRFSSAAVASTRTRLPLAAGKMGSTVQVGPPAGRQPLLSPALQELSVARHLSCSVSGLARFSLP
jgi:hypothetical protein